MKRLEFIFYPILGLAAGIACASDMGACPAQVMVKNGASSAIVVDSGVAARRLEPEFFSFNLEWVEFQNSLWDAALGKARPDVVNWLRAFPGAIYRYPGGTIANSLDWRDMVGDVAKRPSRPFVNWTGPFQARFGPDEYLNFVKSVNGQAWYVANIYGDASGEISPQTLAAQAGQLASYFAKKQQSGLPGILRWELGNELERDKFRWPPDKMIAAAKPAAAAIRRADAQAKFTVMMEEHAALGDIGISASQYNRKLAGDLREWLNEYAMHVYYDGKPGGQPVPSRVNSICSAIADAKSVDPQSSPTIWLTEHARVPPNAWVDPDWKYSWPRTGDLEAAIGVADMLIASAQIPGMRATFIHSLHGTDGPWPLFHAERDRGMHPGAVYWALRILRDAMLANVLPTTTSSRNVSRYEGGYDLRTVVMTDDGGANYSIWAVNRSAQTLQANLTLAALKNLKLPGKRVSLSDGNLRANNYVDGKRVMPSEKPVEIAFDRLGKSQVDLPPYSISAISFNIHEAKPVVSEE